MEAEREEVEHNQNIRSSNLTSTAMEFQTKIVKLGFGGGRLSKEEGKITDCKAFAGEGFD